MNRVYKVIWSKAKHCYVVTSEIAKSHTKGESTGRGLKKLAAALLVAAALMGPNFAWAAGDTVTVKDTTEVEQIVYTQKGADDQFATKTDLAAKANAADVENTYAKTADVANTYVNKTDAQVTNLTVYRDVEAYGNLQVGNGNFTVSGITGNVTTGSAAIGGALTVDGDTEIDGDLGVTGNLFAGGYTETDAKAALNADGSIKGAEGKFTVGTDGKVTAASGKIGTVDITSDGALTGMKSLGVENINAGGTITGNKLTDGVASLQAGNLNTTGNINAHDINAHDIVATGDISGKAISGTTITGTSLNTKGGDISGGAITGTTITGTTITGTSLNTQNGAIIGGAITGTTITATGKISTGGDVVSTGGKVQGTSVSDGTAILSGGSLTDAVNITASGTITGHDVVVNDKLTTKNLEVTDGLKTDHITLGSDGLNQTDINKGNVTSIAYKNVGTVGYMAESIFNEDGSSITVRTNEGRVDFTGSSTVGSQIITQYLGNNAVPGGNNVTRRMVRNDNGTFSMVDTAVNGKDKYSIVSQNAEERKVTVTDGTKTLNVTENLTGGIVSETDDGAGNKVTLTQGMDGTYKVVTSGTSTEEIGGKKMENYNGGLATEITGDETHHVTKNQTITVTGKSSLSAADIENKASSSIWNHVGEGYNTSWKMTDGKISESIVNGTASNKENTTVDGTKRIITNDKGTGTYNQTATSNNISLKNEAEGTSFTKSESLLDGEKTSVTNPNGSSTINQSAESIVNFVKNSEGTTKTEQSAKDITNIAKNGTITNNAMDVLNKGTNSVINKVGDNKVAVKTDRVKVAYGSDTYTTWNDKGITSNTSGDMSNSATNITNSATEKLSNSAADIKNSATESITDKVGENVKRTMTTNKISESVKDDAKSNSFSKTAERDINIITDGTKTSTESQLADSVNTSLKEVDGAGNTTKSLNNVKTVSEDTTKMTDAASGAFSKRSQTVSQIQDKVGKTTVTTIDGKTELTNEDRNHKTVMDYANVTKDLNVNGDATVDQKLTVKGDSDLQGNATVGKNLEVKGTSTLTGDVTMESNATVTKDLTVKGASEFVGRADFRNDVYVDNNLFVKGETRTGTLYVDHDGYVDGDLYVAGNIETHDAELSENSRQVVTGRQLYQTNERVDKLDNRIKKVGANAAALAALRPGDFNPDDKFSIAAGFGSYRNANAAALGLFYRPNENVLLSLGTSFGDGENMVNAGVSVKFGRGKSMAERRKEMADEVSSMRDEMRSQDERIAELEEMLKKQSELIEKLSKES